MDIVQNSPAPDDVVARVETLENRMNDLETQRHWREWLTTLAPSDLSLSQQIPVSIEFNGDDYIAQFIDAGIGASGDTLIEAIWNLRDTIVLKFTRLSELKPEQLGPVPQRQLAVLRNFVSQV